MNYNKQFNSACLTCLALAGALIAIPSNCMVSAMHQQEHQQSPAQQSLSQSPAPPQNSQPATQQLAQPDRPTAKQHKVWTNDDVILLRTPADNYRVEKEAKETAKAEAAAKLAIQPKEFNDAPLQIGLPSSVEETQLMIKNKEREISDAQATLASLNAELISVPEEQKKTKEKEFNIVSGELDRARRELEVLQAHLLQLHSPSVIQTPAAPPFS